MSGPHNILVVEDSEADFGLVWRHLEAHGMAARCRRVASLDELKAALDTGSWDVVLSDFRVPRLDFLDGLHLLQARLPDVPVILISGGIGEEQAVEVLKLGVSEFVLKDNLTRLIPAIERSLREAAAIRERKQAEAETKLRGEELARLNTELTRSNHATMNLMLDALADRDRLDKTNQDLRQEMAQRQQADAALRLSEERFRTLVTATSQMVWQSDAAGENIADVPSWQEFTGQSSDEMRGCGWSGAIHPDDSARVKEQWARAVAAKTAFKSEYRIRGRDGRYRDFATRGVPIKEPDGTIREWVGTCTDITERRQAEAEIQKLNSELERRVGERTAELLAVNKELEAFSYSISHDLRAPLRAIDGYSRLLAEDHNDGLDDDGRRMLAVVRSEAQRMSRLIDELLDFSRLGRQVIELRETDMRALAGAACEEACALESGRKITVEIAALPAAHGEPTMLRQVWANLIGNAVKFTRHRDGPRIEVGASHENGETVYFVRDNGAGFDMAHAGKLFGVFQRLHGEEEFDGTGVGLAFVKRIVERHGGRIWAEGAIDKGATFCFALPDWARKETAI